MTTRVRALVVEIQRSEQKPHGQFEFVQLPRVGELVTLPIYASGLQLAEVVPVEHAPVMAEPDTLAAKVRAEKGPWAIVYVRHFSVVDGGY